MNTCIQVRTKKMKFSIATEITLQFGEYFLSSGNGTSKKSPERITHPLRSLNLMIELFVEKNKVAMVAQHFKKFVGIILKDEPSHSRVDSHVNLLFGI